jgi:hypothetical protein
MTEITLTPEERETIEAALAWATAAVEACMAKLAEGACFDLEPSSHARALDLLAAG